MANNFVEPGHVIQFAPAAAVASGDGALIGTRIGVALVALGISVTGSFAVRGVYTLPKLSTDVVTQGALLYWDNINKRLTLTSAGNTLAGYAWAAAGSGVATVQININA